MEQLFISTYRKLASRRWLIYALIAVSTAVFGFYASKLYFEEDISKLLPQTDSNTFGGLAFADLKVKDKLFVQITASDSAHAIDVEQLAAYADQYMEMLTVADSAGLIANALYYIEDDFMYNAIDFAQANLPAYIEEKMYARFDSLLQADCVVARMQDNYDLLFNQGMTEYATLVQQDPAGLRYAFLPEKDKLGAGFSVINQHLFCADSTVALAFVSPAFNSMDSKAGIALVEIVEQTINAFQAEHPEVEILFHGAPVQSVFNSRQIKKDLALTLTISLLIIGLVICICFRNRGTLTMLLSPVLYGALFAMACMYWIKGSMSLLAIGIGAVVLGVALSYVLHIITHYKYVSDPEQVIRDQARPVVLSCITTIGAFMGLMLTKSALLQDFGLFASLALVGTTVFSLVFLPHFFNPAKNKRSERAFRILDRVNEYRIDKQQWLLVLIVAVSVMSFYTSSLVNFDSNLRNIGYNEPKVIRSQELYELKNNRGNKSMYYAATASTLDSALMYNTRLVAALDSLCNAQTIASYSNMTQLLVPTQVQEERIACWQDYWLDNKVNALMEQLDREGVKNGFSKGTFEGFRYLVEADYEPASLYEAQIVPDGLMSNIVECTGGNYLVFTSALIPPAQVKAVNDRMATLPHVLVVDPFYYTNNMVEIIHNDFNTVLLISSIFVFLVLLISYRSFTISLLAFMPMFLSWYIVQGIMGIFGIEFNLINIVISSFIFGIGVDYSIFITDGLINQTKGNSTSLLVYHKTAILLSAFVLIVLVASMLFATHPAIQSIGVSTLIGMLATVLIAYTLQPFLYRCLFRYKMKKQ